MRPNLAVADKFVGAAWMLVEILKHLRHIDSVGGEPGTKALFSAAELDVQAFLPPDSRSDAAASDLLVAGGVIFVAPELAGVAVQSEDALDVLLRVVIGADDSSEYVVYQGPRRPPSAFADAGLLALGPRHAGGARGGRVCVFGGPCSLRDPTQLPLPDRAVIQRSNYF